MTEGNPRTAAANQARRANAEARRVQKMVDALTGRGWICIPPEDIAAGVTITGPTSGDNSR